MINNGVIDIDRGSIIKGGVNVTDENIRLSQTVRKLEAEKIDCENKYGELAKVVTYIAEEGSATFDTYFGDSHTDSLVNIKLDNDHIRIYGPSTLIPVGTVIYPPTNMTSVKNDKVSHWNVRKIGDTDATGCFNIVNGQLVTSGVIDDVSVWAAGEQIAELTLDHGKKIPIYLDGAWSIARFQNNVIARI